MRPPANLDPHEFFDLLENARVLSEFYRGLYIDRRVVLQDHSRLSRATEEVQAACKRWEAE